MPAARSGVVSRSVALTAKTKTISFPPMTIAPPPSPGSPGSAPSTPTSSARTTGSRSSTRCSRAAASASSPPPSSSAPRSSASSLTHAHGDHIGSLDELAERLPGVEVLISARDARLMAKDMSLGPRRAAGQAPRRLPGSEDAADADLRAGRARRLARGRRRARPHARARRAPRHARRHAAVRRRVHHHQRRGDHGDGQPALPAGVDGDLEPRRPSCETARALRALDPARLAPGHGKIVEAPGAAMDAAIAKAA